MMSSKNSHQKIFEELIRLNPNSNKEEETINNDEENHNFNEEEKTINNGEENHNYNEEEETINNDEENQNFNEEEEEEEEECDDTDDTFEISSYSKHENIDETNNNDETEKKNPYFDLIYDFSLFQANQMEYLKKLSSRLNISIDAAYFLLKKFNWNIDIFFEHWENNKDDVLRFLNENVPVKSKYIGKGTCDICCNDDMILYRLNCGHVMCFECFKNEILYQLKEQQFPIVCRNEDCNREVMLSDIIFFCGEETAARYCNNYIEYQMSLDNQRIKCPAPDCSNFLDRNSITLCNVCRCTCGKRICFECKQDAHAPLTCGQVEKWNQISQEMEQLEEAQNTWLKLETLLWMSNFRNVDEAQKAFDECGANFEKEHVIDNEKEYNEIKEIQQQIEKETNPQIQANLRQKLAEKESIYEYKRDERRKEIRRCDNTYYDELVKRYKRDNFGQVKDPQTKKLRKHKKPKVTFEKAMIKNCPKCKAEIVKDGGCNHMKCHHCKYEFCWVCLDVWKTHGSNYFDCPNAKSKQNLNAENVNDNDNKYVLIPKRIKKRQRSRQQILDEVLRIEDFDDEIYFYAPNSNGNSNANHAQNNNDNDNANHAPNINDNNNTNDASNSNDNDNANYSPNINDNNNTNDASNSNDNDNTNHAQNYNDNDIIQLLTRHLSISENRQQSDYTAINEVHYIPYEGEYEYEYEEEKDNEEIHIDRKFVLPPLIGKKRIEYLRWKKAIQKRMDLIKYTQNINSAIDPSIKEAFEYARSVLLNSYALLSMLEQGSLKTKMLEFYTDNLEKLFMQFTRWSFRYSVENIDNLYKSISNLLFYANFINF